MFLILLRVHDLDIFAIWRGVLAAISHDSVGRSRCHGLLKLRGAPGIAILVKDVEFLAFTNSLNLVLSRSGHLAQPYHAIPILRPQIVNAVLSIRDLTQREFSHCYVGVAIVFLISPHCNGEFLDQITVGSREARHLTLT